MQDTSNMPRNGYLHVCLLFVAIAKCVHCVVQEEVFIKLKGSFKWEPLLITFKVNHKALCISNCLHNTDCIAIYVTVNADSKLKWSCDLLGKLVIGSVQRLESGYTWINKSESTICPGEFSYVVNGNCYYLETKEALSWNNSKTKCQTLHWYSDLAELETMAEYNDLMTAMTNDISG